MWDLEAFGGNVAVIDDTGASLTYSQLHEASEELRSRIGGRCLIFILCRNSISSITGYVAALNNRIVPLMLNADLDRGALSDLISKYGPRFLWAPCDSADGLGFENVYSDGRYCLLRNPDAADIAMHDDLALLLTTSGSTGSPKFVRQTYRNIEANTESIVEYLGIVQSDRAITTLPMNYTYGLSIINTHLHSGATLLVTDKTLMQK